MVINLLYQSTRRCSDVTCALRDVAWIRLVHFFSFQEKRKATKLPFNGQ